MLEFCCPSCKGFLSYVLIILPVVYAGCSCRSFAELASWFQSQATAAGREWPLDKAAKGERPGEQQKELLVEWAQSFCQQVQSGRVQQQLQEQRQEQGQQPGLEQQQQEEGKQGRQQQEQEGQRGRQQQRQEGQQGQQQQQEGQQQQQIARSGASVADTGAPAITGVTGVAPLSQEGGSRGSSRATSNSSSSDADASAPAAAVGNLLSYWKKGGDKVLGAVAAAAAAGAAGDKGLVGAAVAGARSAAAEAIMLAGGDEYDVLFAAEAADEAARAAAAAAAGAADAGVGSIESREYNADVDDPMEWFTEQKLLEYGQQVISKLERKEQKQQFLLESSDGDEGGGGYGDDDLVTDDVMTDDLTDLTPGGFLEEWERDLAGGEGGLSSLDGLEGEGEVWEQQQPAAADKSSPSAAAVDVGGDISSSSSSSFVTDQQLHSRNPRFWDGPTHPLPPSPLPQPEGILLTDSLPLNHPEIAEAVAPELDSIRRAIAALDKELQVIQPVVRLARQVESRFHHHQLPAMVKLLKFAVEMLQGGKVQIAEEKIQLVLEVGKGKDGG